MILFSLKSHKRYISMLVNQNIPQDSSDSVRVTLAYFFLSSLDILNSLDKFEDRHQKYIDWIYHLQSHIKYVSGFQNSSAFSIEPEYQWGHVAATYSALNCLLILRDDLSKVNKKSIIESLRLLQLEDGSFCAAKEGSENDMRFVYCAACICYILDDWSGMNVDKAVEYILNSISYDGGIGQGPNLESHGGSSYCAIATLALTNRLDSLTSDQKKRLIRWILFLQRDGFRGRPNKVDDTCYTFWLGATLKILDAYNFIDKERLYNFVLSTQDFQMGGFGKWGNTAADPLHTYLGLAGLSLMKHEGLNEIMPALNITYRTYEHLKSLHKKWRA